MSDWVENSEEAAIPKIVISNKKKWIDEDIDEDQIKDSWDVSSDEEEEKNTKAETATVTKKKKGSVAKKIAEKEEQKKKEAAAKKAKKQNGDDEDSDSEGEEDKEGDDDEGDDDDDDDPAEKRKRIYQEQLKSDLENAESMFRGVSIKDTEGSPLDKINPKTRDEFDEFSKLLCERIKKHEKQALYVTFINGFVKELCSNLKDVEIRKLSSILSTLANEKTRATKEKGKKKNKPKPTLHAELDETADFGNYHDEYDDDFM